MWRHRRAQYEMDIPFNVGAATAFIGFLFAFAFLRDSQQVRYFPPLCKPSSLNPTFNFIFTAHFFPHASPFLHSPHPSTLCLAVHRTTSNYSPLPRPCP
jgi:hypothetical protein